MYDICKPIKKIQFSIASEKLIKDLSTVSITIPELYENNFPKFSGLFDLRMGTQDYLFLCKICKQNMKDCYGHFGHIELARKVYYIHFLAITKKLLQCVCYKCSSILINKMDVNLINSI